MDKLAKTRLSWIKLYQETQNAGVVCRRCGIARPTLRKWLRRYEAQGIAGLKELSRAPLRFVRKVTSKHEELILSLRSERKLGVRRVQSEIKRLHDISLSLATIHKFLTGIRSHICKRNGIIVKFAKDITANCRARECRWMSVKLQEVCISILQ